MTPAVLLIRDHYAKRKLTDGWTWWHAAKLMGLMGCTPRELAELLMVPVQDMMLYQERNRVPPTVALHMAQLEAAYCRVLRGWKTAPIMPDLSKVSNA